MSTAVASPPAPARASVWRHADFRRLWVGETASSLGSSVTAVALPLVALTTLHAGVLAVSLLSAVAWLPWLVIGLPAGAWVDRLPRRRVMIVCDVGSMLLFASVPVAVWLGVLDVAQLLVVALLTGVAKVFFSTAYRAFLPTLLPRELLVDGNSRLQGSESAANVAGPGLGGALAQAFGAATGLLADAVSFAVSLLCLVRIKGREAPVATAGRSTLRRDIAAGLAFVARDRLLRVFMVFGGAANFALTGTSAIMIAFLVRQVGLGAGGAGLLIAVASTGGVLGAFVAPAVARRLGTARALLLAKVGLAPAALLIPLTAAGWRLGCFVAGDFVMGGGIVAGNVVTSGFMQAYCPQRLMGRITTTMQVVNFGAIPVGAVAGGLLASAVGYRPALWVLAAVFVASGGILLTAPIRRARDLPARPAEPS